MAVTTMTAAEYRAMRASFKAKGGRTPHGRGIAQAAWSDLGGHHHYYKSKAERRFAAYLEFKLTRGEIQSWTPEEKRFEFMALRHGVTSYLPDFRVTMNDGTIRYFEVKGWLDPKSRTALKRMKLYYPEISITLIDKAWFKTRAPSLAALVPHWEP